MNELQHAPLCSKHGVEKKRVGKARQWACPVCVREANARSRAKKIAMGLTTTGKHRERMRKAHPTGHRIPQAEAGAFIGPKEQCGCGLVKRYYWNGRRYSGRCNPCDHASRSQKQHKQAAARNRRWMLKKRYGITVEQYELLLERQGHRCAICERSEPVGVTKAGHDGEKKWHIDHCHESGEVRGLLCGECNKGLGQFRDDKVSIQKALEYLNGGNKDLVAAVLNDAAA